MKILKDKFGEEAVKKCLIKNQEEFMAKGWKHLLTLYQVVAV